VTGVKLVRTGQTDGCPATVNFKGEITAAGPGEVHYVFYRNDGGMSAPERILRFNSAGSQGIDTTWTLSRNYKGWVAVRITSPNTLESGQAGFVLNSCR
jgi:hypothetical protein